MDQNPQLEVPKLPEKGIRWNEVTWYSKLLSIIFLLGVVPVLAFYIGVQYEDLQIQKTQGVEKQTPLDTGEFNQFDASLHEKGFQLIATSTERTIADKKYLAAFWSTEDATGNATGTLALFVDNGGVLSLLASLQMDGAGTNLYPGDANRRVDGLQIENFKNNSSPQVFLSFGTDFGTAGSETYSLNIYDLHNNSLVSMQPPSDFGGDAFPEDIKKDGNDELIMHNPSSGGVFPAPEPSNASPVLCLPSYDYVFSWENGSFIDVSKQFPQYYKDSLSALDQHLNPNGNLGSAIFGDCDVVLAVDKLYDYIQAGEGKQGASWFVGLLKNKKISDPSDPALLDSTKRFVDALNRQYQ